MRFLHLTLRGLSHLRKLPELVEIFQSIDDEVVQERLSGGLASRLGIPKPDSEWLKKEAETGFPHLHAHTLVGLWSTLETLCEDSVVAWLTHLKEAWQTPEVVKLKVSLLVYHKLPEEERPRFVAKELSRSLNAGFGKGVGRFKEVLSVFSLSPAVGPNVQRALHELHQLRNVIVHCGSIADQRLLKECPWLEFAVGDRVRVSHDLHGWYYQAAKRYAERILNQALLALGFPGCECPGMNEIGDRPSSKAGKS